MQRALYLHTFIPTAGLVAVRHGYIIQMFGAESQLCVVKGAFLWEY